MRCLAPAAVVHAGSLRATPRTVVGAARPNAKHAPVAAGFAAYDPPAFCRATRARYFRRIW